MNKKWNEKTTSEKVISAISFVALCVWLVFEVVERKTTLEYAKYVNYIAIFIICVCEAISFWKVKRFISYIAVGGAFFMIAVAALEVMLFL